MIALDFRGLVKSLCDHAGIASWETVLAEREVEIDGVTVGLLHDECDAPDHLGLFFDLGDCEAGEPARTRLLEFNLRAAPGQGRMGLLSPGARIVYRVDLPWTAPMEGAQLEASLIAHLAVARGALQAEGPAEVAPPPDVLAGAKKC